MYRLHRMAAWIRRRVERRGVILLYHRIAELESDPWALAVTPRHFAEHLAVLREYVYPVRLRSIREGIRAARIPRRSVAITFDDGYLDNLIHAKPLLERYDVPATVFVPSAQLATGREFWWDELDTLLLQPGTLAAQLRVTLNGRVHSWELGAEATYTRAVFLNRRGWRAWEPPPGRRQEVYRELWELLHPLGAEQRSTVMSALREAVRPGARQPPAHPVMTEQTLTELARGQLIEVGGHTVTHPCLAALTLAEQRSEIGLGKTRLEQIVGRPVTAFSYPFGMHDAFTRETTRVVRECGFDTACTSFRGGVSRTTDPFQLPRVFVTDMDGDAFRACLTEWLPLSTTWRIGRDRTVPGRTLTPVQRIIDYYRARQKDG